MHTTSLKHLATAAILSLGALCAESLIASPALRQIITRKQPDGTQIKTMLVGDEYASSLINVETGECLILDEETQYYRPMNEVELSAACRQWEAGRQLASISTPKRVGSTPNKQQIKVPVLLVQFSDLKFSEECGSKDFFETLLNDTENERLAFVGKDSKNYYTSSARKYFQDQSLGNFDPQFDILQTVTLSKSYAYYGAGSGTNISLLSTLLNEAVKAAISQGDLSKAKQYDSNNDGYVDLLYIIYAGWGENEGASSEYLWPCNFTSTVSTTDGTKVRQCCITNELKSFPGLSNYTGIASAGIGTFVHEMSHALGLPDFYGTNSSTADNCYGMDAWSVMDQGQYNGQSQIPAVYTLHERMQMGWCDAPDTVPTNKKVILEPIAKNGKGLILRNPKNADEYLTIEVHHNSAGLWDRTWGTGPYYKYSINNGLLITHVDYNASIWNGSTVNTVPNRQRCTPLAADGVQTLYKTIVDSSTKAAFLNSFKSDIFPGYSNITTLNSTNPLAKWYTGEKIDIDITNVVILSDGSVEITFGHPHTITYMVDGKEYKTIETAYQQAITPETEPTKEGYTFSGWSEIPETMPDKDLVITGTFAVNSYSLTYKVDGEEYKNTSVAFGSKITPEAEPAKEGYTFSGWSEIPETMPAQEVEITGTFAVNSYSLTYKVDGEEYKNTSVTYGTKITPEAEPTKEGHTFSGWSEIPETMPAQDVEITGTFAVNSYSLTYKVDGEEYKNTSVAFGSKITPEAEPTKEGYTFSGWSEIPETMPAQDVEIYGTFTVIPTGIEALPQQILQPKKVILQKGRFSIQGYDLTGKSLKH